MNEEIKEETEVLKEILKWIKIGGIKEVKEVLMNNLTDDNKKLVYHFSDGEKNMRDICRITGIKSTATISNYWNQWKKIGIVEIVPAKRGERIKKIFELNDFDIEVPKINIKVNKSSEENTNAILDSESQEEISNKDDSEFKEDILKNSIEEKEDEPKKEEG